MTTDRLLVQTGSTRDCRGSIRGVIGDSSRCLRGNVITVNRVVKQLGPCPALHLCRSTIGRNFGPQTSVCCICSRLGPNRSLSPINSSRLQMTNVGVFVSNDVSNRATSGSLPCPSNGHNILLASRTGLGATVGFTRGRRLRTTVRTVNSTTVRLILSAAYSLSP